MIRRKKGWKSQPRGPDGRWVKSSAQIHRSGKGRKRPIRFLRVGRCADKDGIFSVYSKIPEGDPEKATSRYRNVLNKSFTEKERQLLKENGLELRIDRLSESTGDRHRVMAEYIGKKNGKHTIVVDPEYMTPETLTHETIHVLQEVDDTRPRLDRQLRRDAIADSKTQEGIDEFETLKESLTEAETLSRTKYPEEDELGYYDDLPGSKEKRIGMKMKDHNILRNNMNSVRKEGHANNVYNRFRNLHIRNLKLYSSKKTAIQVKESIDRKKRQTPHVESPRKSDKIFKKVR